MTKTLGLDYNFCMATKISKKEKGVKKNEIASESVQVDKAFAELKQSQIDSYDELENYKKFLKARKKRLIARIISFAVLIILLPFFIFLGAIIIDKDGRHNFFGYTYYIVATNSMEPEINVNDCVVIKKVSSVSELQIGDDIGYIDAAGNVIVHRIMDIREGENGNLEFITGGINNPSYDQQRVSADKVVGKRTATLKILGNIIVFFRTTAGIIVIVLILVMLVGAFYFIFRLTEDIRHIEVVEK